MSNHSQAGGRVLHRGVHPFATCCSSRTESGDIRRRSRYFHHELFLEGGEPGYAGKEVIETPTYEWPHSLGDIVCALIDAALRIEFLHEFPFTCYQAYPVMERGDDGWWRLPKHNESGADVLDKGDLWRRIQQP